MRKMPEHRREQEVPSLTGTQTNFHSYIFQLKFMRRHKFIYKRRRDHSGPLVGRAGNRAAAARLMMKEKK